MAPIKQSTAASPACAGTLLSHTFEAFIPGTDCPKLIKAPEEHMGEKVPVVTTSTCLAASTAPSFLTILIISSAVTTTTSPDLIFSLIS